VAVSATLCDESLRVVAGGWNGSVQVYKCDNAAAVGTLATNPPALDERLTAAQQRLQEKTTASAPAIEAGRKAAEELAAVERSLAADQQAAAGLQAQIEAVTGQAGEVQKSPTAPT
jgi:hypothetical protein